MVRVGLLAQPQVAEILNEHFVCVELNSTIAGGVPDDIPALKVLKDYWDQVMYARVAFAGEWVLDSRGEVLLGNSGCKHRAGERQGLELAEVFQRALEVGLKRQERLNRAEHGTPAYDKVVEGIEALMQKDLREYGLCWIDPDVMTDHYFKTVVNQGKTPEAEARIAFEKRYVQMFIWEDSADVRRKAVEAWGRYAQQTEARIDEEVVYLADQAALLLEDEDAEVRRAAAEALYHMRQLDVPELAEDELIAAAGEMWWDGREKPERMVVGQGLPTVWPYQRKWD